ncbi:MAG: hypothetical protein WC150_13750 [Bacteroidia bacterium]
MKNKYSLVLLLAAFCCMNVQCNKDEKTELEKLPPISTYGANTFGCLVNGDAWPMNAVSGVLFYDFSYFDGMTVLSYEINDNNGVIKEGINIVSKRMVKKGFYEIGYDNNGEFFSAKFDNERYVSGYKKNIDLGRKAIVNILRLDTIQGIISGTFSFSLFNEKGTKEIHITNGRFDYNY